MPGEKLSDFAAIKHFFENENGKKINMEELKGLTPEDKVELGELARRQLAKV